MSRVLVVGGGIAGLAAARGWRSGGFDDITVCEARESLGRQDRRNRHWRGSARRGAESLLARRPEAVGPDHSWV